MANKCAIHESLGVDSQVDQGGPGLTGTLMMNLVLAGLDVD
jgi:hypothetical protein